MRHPKSLCVFEDAIHSLEEDLGYIRGKDVDACPYDWRIPPGHLETRDGYFTETMKRIERMYEDNDCIPIILACHSLGSKVVHYLLNFCLREKGQDWVDSHIHTYMVRTKLKSFRPFISYNLLFPLAHSFECTHN